MEDLVINLTLEPGRWSAPTGGWQVEPLRLPGSTVVGLFADGKVVDPKDYEVDGDLVRFGDRRPAAAVALRVKIPIPSRDARKKELELAERRDEEEAAFKRHQLRVTLGLGILSFVGGLLAAYIGLHKPAEDPKPERDTQALRDCRNGLDSIMSASNHPDATVNTIRSALSNEVPACLRTLERASR